MEQNQNPSPNKKPGDDKRPKSNMWVTLIVTVAIVLLISSLYNAIVGSQYTKKTYSDFLQAMENGELAEVELQVDRIVYMTKEEAEKKASEQKACFTGLPSGGDTMALAAQLDAMGVKVNKQIVQDNSFVIMILSYVFMFAAIFGMTRMLTKRMGGDGLMGGFGKSKAKVYMEKQTGVTFKDVAGQDEAKESLQEIIDFLHNPQKYTEIGA